LNFQKKLTKLWTKQVFFILFICSGNKMIGLTRRGEYAIRGMIYLAQKPTGTLFSLAEIAAAIDAPVSFCAKIFQSLVRAGFVTSARGVGGGLTIGKKGLSITLLELVERVEGPILLNKCLSGPQTCSRDNQCKVHYVWNDIQSEITKKLSAVTLADLI
jgi:Rrf2 family protein